MITIIIVILEVISFNFLSIIYHVLRVFNVGQWSLATRWTPPTYIVTSPRPMLAKPLPWTGAGGAVNGRGQRDVHDHGSPGVRMPFPDGEQHAADCWVAWWPVTMGQTNWNVCADPFVSDDRVLVML